MANQKNIDQLFQKKFKDFEQEPRPEVWLQIEEHLTKKKKRRVLPMWWYGGVAVVLIGLILSPFLLKEKNTTDPVHIQPTIITTVPSESLKKTIPKEKNNIPEVIEKRPDFKQIIKESAVIANTNKTRVSKDKNSPIVTNKGTEKRYISLANVGTLPPSYLERFRIISFKGDLLSHKSTINHDSSVKSLLDVVKKNDSLSNEKNSFKKRWGISPSYGYTKSNSFSSTSSIDQSLDNNPLRGNSNAAFGVNVHYTVSRKWGFRSGIYTQQLSFTTKNIGIVSGVSSNGLSSINFDQNVLTSSFGGAVYIGPVESSQDIASLVSSADIVSNNAVLLQRYGYIEVPLEITYALKSTDRFSLGLVSGLSTLFLNKNDVQLKSSQFTSTIGEANNLNKINISTNFGLDFDYSFTKNWSLNLNPMVKVHMNTFSKKNTNFQPFFMGIYTGVKYQF